MAERRQVCSSIWPCASSHQRVHLHAWPLPQIVERDVPARYLLRLGMGEAELETELDFRCAQLSSLD